MTTFYEDRHLSCGQYATSKSASIKCLEFENLSAPRVVVPNYSTIVLVIEGDAHINCDLIQQTQVKAGEIYLVPSGTEMRMCVPGYIKFITVTFTSGITLCNKFTLSDLIAGNHTLGDEEFVKLPIRDMMSAFCKLAKGACTDHLDCVQYHRMLVNQLFFLLRAYYSEEELYRFFYPILSYDLVFRDKVLSKFREADGSVAQFAEMLNMSVSTFNKKFKDEFDETPSVWLAKRKAELLYIDITMTNLTMAEITDKHGFSTQAYMITFCKKHFVDTPQFIRDNIHNKRNYERFRQNCKVTHLHRIR